MKFTTLSDPSISICFPFPHACFFMSAILFIACISFLFSVLQNLASKSCGGSWFISWRCRSIARYESFLGGGGGATGLFPWSSDVELVFESYRKQIKSVNIGFNPFLCGSQSIFLVFYWLHAAFIKSSEDDSPLLTTKGPGRGGVLVNLPSVKILNGARTRQWRKTQVIGGKGITSGWTACGHINSSFPKVVFIPNQIM